MAMDLVGLRAEGAAFLVSGMALLAVAILAFLFSMILSLGIVGIAFTLIGVALVNRQRDAAAASGDR